MRAIVLAAGYATRLYPLTENFPKPLLELGGRTILDHLLIGLNDLPLTGVAVVCNARFIDHFEDWCPQGVRLVTNSSTSVDNRLGAVGDLALAIDACADDDDLLVAAADTVFAGGAFQLLADPAPARTTVAVWHNDDAADRQRRGNVELGAQDRVRRFVEKPGEPHSEWSAAPLYFFVREDLALVREYLESGGNPDAPGHLFEWLAVRTDVDACRLQARPTDIGTLDALDRARETFR